MPRCWVIALSLLAAVWTGACEPLPGRGPSGPYSEPEPPEIVTIQTSNPQFFYLVDTRRALCFFGNRRSPQLTRVPCEELPEARDIFGWDEPATTGPDEIPLESPPPSEEDAPPISEPTADERTRFEAAYVEMLCARRKSREGGPVDVDAVVATHGLSSERYADLKALLSKDGDYWRALSHRALTACR